MKVAFLTLGCKVNSYETEKMKEQFQEKGHMIVAFEEQADVYIVNTCTVTNIADRKSRKMLHRARRQNKDALVVAMGCYVDSARKKGETDESVDVFIGNEQKEQLVEMMENMLREEKGGKKGQEKSRAAREEEHTRAYVKVQNGCNQYCTYCIIPYVRGPLTSKPEKQVVAEVEQLAGRGIQEVVLTGIHLSSYGVDFSQAKSFLELEGKPLLSLIEAVAQVPGIKRIRLGSLEPRIITEEFVKHLCQQKKICPHFHLSLQSGCDETLRRMNRHYTGEEYLEKLRILRKYFEYPAITTDIIVGFPGETEEEFHTTCEFARKAAFAQIHVFKYSRRQGTMADAMEGQVSDQIKTQRSDELLQLEQELEQAYGVRFLGQETRVLMEEITDIQGKEYLTGYNERYVRIGVPVTDWEKAVSLCNQIVSVRISGQETAGIYFGEMVKIVPE